MVFRRESPRPDEVREALKNRVMEHLGGVLTPEEKKVLPKLLEEHPEINRAAEKIINTLEAHKHGRTIFGVSAAGLGLFAVISALTGGAGALPLAVGALAAGGATGALHAGRPKYKELLDKHAKRIAEQILWSRKYANTLQK